MVAGVDQVRFTRVLAVAFDGRIIVIEVVVDPGKY